MNWRKVRIELIHFITSITMPSGIIIGAIYTYHNYPYGTLMLIGGIISIPIYAWNVRNGSKKV